MHALMAGKNPWIEKLNGPLIHGSAGYAIILFHHRGHGEHREDFIEEKKRDHHFGSGGAIRGSSERSSA